MFPRHIGFPAPRIAVIGGGVAGMGAALRLLSAGLQVTIFDPSEMLGGNCHGVTVEGPDGQEHRIDAGVSDFNIETFPGLRNLIEQLGLEIAPIGQSASFMTAEGQTCWHTAMGTPIYRAGVADPALLQTEIARFRRESVEVLSDPAFEGWTLGQYLDLRGYGPDFRDLYLFPRAAGCFPMPDLHPRFYDLRGLVRFWSMHGIAGGSGTPQRRCVVGGMHRYMATFEDHLRRSGALIRTGCRLDSVTRAGLGGQVELCFTDERGTRATRCFDHAVFACGPDIIRRLIAAPRPDEAEVFDSVPVQYAPVIVHRDRALLPDDPTARSAYNYLLIDEANPATLPTITFDVARLRNDSSLPDVFVSMNPFRDPDPRKVIAELTFEHPIADGRTAERAARIETHQGRDGFWFCGAYLREPFVHESALQSGFDVADRMLATLHLRAA